MKCKFYSEEIGKCLFDGPPDDCHFEDNENNCTCFEPIKGSKNMKKCKYHLDYESGQYDSDLCSYDKCKYNGFPAICIYQNEEENCTYFTPIEGEKEPSTFTLKYDKAKTTESVLDKGRPTDKTALTIQNCDRIILKPKSLEVEVKIEKDNFDDFDYIVINGIKFKKV